MLKVGILDFKRIPNNGYFYTPKNPISQPLKSYKKQKNTIKSHLKNHQKHP